jgi:hypothetical protein
VTTALVVAVAAAGLVLAAACAVEAIRDRPAGIALLAVAAVAELVLLVAVGASVVALARGHDPASTATAIGYLVGVPFVVPVAAFSRSPSGRGGAASCSVPAGSSSPSWPRGSGRSGSPRPRRWACDRDRRRSGPARRLRVRVVRGGRRRPRGGADRHEVLPGAAGLRALGVRRGRLPRRRRRVRPGRPDGDAGRVGGVHVELVGVLVVGTVSLVADTAFPDDTVWSRYGSGYLFVPLVLPVAGLLWLARGRSRSG